MKKLFLLVILVIGLYPVTAYAQDYDAKTTYTSDKVSIKINEKANTQEVYDNDEFLFSLHLTGRLVITTSPLNLREVPNTESDIVITVGQGITFKEMGYSMLGWSTIQLDGNIYFVWNEYLAVQTEDVKLFTSLKDDYFEIINKRNWSLIGECRISSYCYKCNTPKNSYKSGISGKPCIEWKTCAANGIPKGTKLYVEGYNIIWVVNDSGPKAMNGGRWIDLFVDTGSCHIWKKSNVWIVE